MGEEVGSANGQPLSEFTVMTTVIFSRGIYASLGIFTLGFLSTSSIVAGGEGTVIIPIMQRSKQRLREDN